MLDRTDETILQILEKDGRLSFNSLAEQIHLSKTPSWTRVQSLERQKVITAYRAEINPAALGLDLHAFVGVRVAADQHLGFEAAAKRHGAVLECYAVVGPADYMLHVLVSGVAALDHLLRAEVGGMPGVKGLLTTITLKEIKPRGLITDCLRYGNTIKR